MSKEKELGNFKPIGTLVDFQWRLGIAIKSQNCNNLGVPYVSILLKVADSDQKVASHTMELTLAEFHEFAKKFNDMSNLMEALS